MNELKLQYYKVAFISVKRSASNGVFNNAKPVLLLSIIDKIDDGTIKDNIIPFSKELNADYKMKQSMFDRLPLLKDLTRDEIKSTGYVVDTLEAALWCNLNSSSYRECILLAVNLGDDTDTVAAVAGGLAGIIYGVGGERGIPEEWINQLAKKEWIADLCGKFEKSLGKEK